MGIAADECRVIRETDFGTTSRTPGVSRLESVLVSRRIRRNLTVEHTSIDASQRRRGETGKWTPISGRFLRRNQEGHAALVVEPGELEGERRGGVGR